MAASENRVHAVQAAQCSRTKNSPMMIGMMMIRESVSRLGRLVSMTRGSDLRRSGGSYDILAVRMEVIINLFGYSSANPFDSLQIRQTGPFDRPRGAEMVQQRLLAGRTNAWNLVDHRLADRLRAPR